MSGNTPQRSNKSLNLPFPVDHHSLNSLESTISSVSGSTGTSWSVPRSRTAGITRKASDGPRRSGSSFRVSLKPNRHRHSSKRNGSIGTEENAADSCFGSGGLKKIIYTILLASMIGVAVHLIDPNAYRISHFYNIYDKPDNLSTEDLIAQGEMSLRTFNDDELHLRKSVSLQEDEKREYMLQHADEAMIIPTEVALPENPTVAAQNSLSNQPITTLLPPEWMNATEKTYRTAALVPITTNRTDWGPSFQRREDGNSTVVAYVLPIYSCYKRNSQKNLNQYGLNDPADDNEFHDAALMLQASIHKNSVRNPLSESVYDYEMVAIIHRGVEQCEGGANRTQILLQLGYRVEVVREPINKVDIHDKYLKDHAPQNSGGQGGMKEMIRLYVFKLVEYKIAVLIEMTTWILNAPDAIFDVLLNGPRNHSWVEDHAHHIVRETFYPNGTIIKSDPLPSEIDIMYTRDYSTMSQGSWNTGISLNFLVVRPNLQTYRSLIITYQSTEYDPDWGWEHKGYVKYSGSMMTKGLITYYFNEKMPHRKLEIHRCIYNNMADVPYIAGKPGEKDNCRDVKEHREGTDGKPVPCTDCRIQSWDEIIVVNFQVCQVPWVCPFVQEVENVPLLLPTLKMCRQFHHSWFAVRASIEISFLTPEERIKTTGTYHPDIFQGYCIPGGQRGGSYVAMGLDVHFPYGISYNRSPGTK